MYIVCSIVYEEVLIRNYMKLLSWNTAKRLKKVSQQSDIIKQINPDVVALQEIIPSSELEFKKLFKSKYPYIVSSFELATDLTILKNKRMFGQLIASKYPFTPLDPKNFKIPWPERVLSVSQSWKKNYNSHNAYSSRVLKRMDKNRYYKRDSRLFQ